MKTHKLNINFSLFRTALAAVCIAASVAFGAPAKLGSTNTYWELVDSTLTISGTGAMPDYNYSSGRVWPSSRITSVVIENGVTTIGEYAFYQHTGLTSVSIGNSVTTIGSAAFLGTGLTTITIPNSVTSIGDYAFRGCTGLTTITIPNSVTTIGSEAFSGCTGLTSVSIGNSVTTIGSSAFNSCTGLTSVSIGNSVTSIGDYAFSGCTGLTSVSIGNSVTSIGDYAFRGCTGLTTITIPNSVTTIGSSAFRGCTGLTSVSIGNSVTSIGSSAFEGCTGLASVSIPASVTTIGSSAFEGCTGLTAINVDGSNANYASDNGVLFNKDKKSMILYPVAKTGAYTIPNSVTSIGDYAFYGRTGLTSVSIGNSVTSIGSSAFEDCTGLTSVSIPASVTTIGSSAFRGCTGLTTITIPNSVTSIGDNAFSGCTGLTSVSIGNSVTSIGSSAFYNCTGLASVSIPASVTTIGSSAFYNCTGLTAINVDAGNANYASIDGVLFNNAKTTLIQYPAAKTGAAFTIPNSVTSIGSSAFRGCTGLASVSIPASVTTIGSSAFSGCTGLKHIVNGVATPQAISNNSQFNQVTLADVNLFVPASAIDAYKAATIWKDFKNIASLSVAKPTFTPATPSLVYTGSEQVGGTIAPALQYEISDIKAIDPGKHTAKVALVSGCEWLDGTKDDLAFEWTIAEAANPILPQIAAGNIRVQPTANAIMLENLPKNTNIQVYNLKGNQTHSINSGNSKILKIQVQTKGIYVVKIGNQTLRVAVR